ncbi:winged helix-turn-helix domain-containing protein [Citricoccus sp. CH26A]|uniref:winged helix-turn-helix domain-containing protein n=1 Tax=Citricoccus TaxID=169133 RepID=UPI003510A218
MPTPVVLAAERPGVVVDAHRREVRVDGELVNVADKQFAVLHCLMAHRGRTVSRPELLQALWEHMEDVPEARTVDVYIRRLRAKLVRFVSAVRTVHGRGYCGHDHPDIPLGATTPALSPRGSP